MLDRSTPFVLLDDARVAGAAPARLYRAPVDTIATDDPAKLAGGNVLRVLRQAEKVSASMKDEPPSMATLQPFPTDNVWK